jgi:hypothetical protein
MFESDDLETSTEDEVSTYYTRHILTAVHTGYAIQYFNGKIWVLGQEKILTMHIYSEVSCCLKYFSKCFLVMDSGHKIALISDIYLRQHIMENQVD